MNATEKKTGPPNYVAKKQGPPKCCETLKFIGWLLLLWAFKIEI